MKEHKIQELYSTPSLIAHEHLVSSIQSQMQILLSNFSQVRWESTFEGPSSLCVQRFFVVLLF